MSKMFKWVIEIQVSESLVEDGFDLTEDDAQEMVNNLFPYYVHPEEVKVAIKKSPWPKKEDS